MERYNLLVVEGEEPGLKIMRTATYASLVAQDPSLIHKNFGDFYSDVSCADLADRVYQALGQEDVEGRLNELTVIVDAASFDQNSCDPEKEYLVRDESGVWFYSPGLHQKDPMGASQAYTTAAFLVIRNLVTDKQEGSLQKQLKKVEAELQAMYDEGTEQFGANELEEDGDPSSN